MSVEPLMRLGSKPIAPVKPVSSSIVKRHSSGGSVAVSSCSSARMVAQPTPLSAPSVVPSAVSHSPWASLTRVKRMGSVSKSNSVSAFFSHTMSTWPWSTTGAASSPPLRPGNLSTRLPTSSCFHSRPRSSAKAFMKFCTASSLRDGRGIEAMAAKFSQSGAGARPSTTARLPGVMTRSAAATGMVLKAELRVARLRVRVRARVRAAAAIIAGAGAVLGVGLGWGLGLRPKRR
mmetsp:Transcript_28255/g.90387  ORF Transcript_28255/g.90387 Transcript_28255/m.90387 type:complete len:233 (+) Transcript_28255:2742-3440(+)